MAESVFTTFWFWMIVLGIIFILIAGIVYAVTRRSSIFIWIFLALGLILILGGVIWDIISSSREVTQPASLVNPFNPDVPTFINIPTSQTSLSAAIANQGMNPFIPQPTNINVFEPSLPGSGFMSQQLTTPVIPRVVGGVPYPVNINV